MNSIGSAYYNTHLQNQFAKLQNAQAEAQAKISSGRKFTQASEDPASALETQRISLRRQEMEGDGHRRDLATRINDVAALTAQQTRDALDELSLKIELAYETGPGSADNANFGASVDQAIEQAASMLNLDLEGRFLFGGSETAQPPFEIVRDAEGAITEVLYNGSTDPLEFDIGLDVRMDPAGNPALNPSWSDWMNNLLTAKTDFENGNFTASKEALNAAGESGQRAFAATTDIIGKATRIATLSEWSGQADTQLSDQEARLQEIDLNASILQFNELQRNYQASLQSGRLLMTLSLVDFL
ncbi:MAG: hypothetical protein ACLFR7_02725 [Opitutales bacterium]